MTLSTNQKYTSKNTSINSSKLPSAFRKLDALLLIQHGMKIADIGGGKFDNAIEWCKDKGAVLLVYDPYNRSESHNKYVLDQIAGNQCDLVVCNNVLNVIAEREVRASVIAMCKNAIKHNNAVCFSVYSGNSSGVGKATQNNQSWQNNLPIHAYLEEIQEHFDQAYVKHGLIFAKDNHDSQPTKRPNRTNTQ